MKDQLRLQRWAWSPNPVLQPGGPCCGPVILTILHGPKYSEPWSWSCSMAKSYRIHGIRRVKHQTLFDLVRMKLQTELCNRMQWDVVCLLKKLPGPNIRGNGPSCYRVNFPLTLAWVVPILGCAVAKKDLWVRVAAKKT